MTSNVTTRVSNITKTLEACETDHSWPKEARKILSNKLRSQRINQLIFIWTLIWSSTFLASSNAIRFQEQDTDRQIWIQDRRSAQPSYGIPRDYRPQQLNSHHKFISDHNEFKRADKSPQLSEHRFRMLKQAGQDLEKFNTNLSKQTSPINAEMILALTNNISELVLDDSIQEKNKTRVDSDPKVSKLTTNEKKNNPSVNSKAQHNRGVNASEQMRSVSSNGSGFRRLTRLPFRNDESDDFDQPQDIDEQIDAQQQTDNREPDTQQASVPNVEPTRIENKPSSPRQPNMIQQILPDRALSSRLNNDQFGQQAPQIQQFLNTNDGQQERFLPSVSTNYNPNLDDSLDHHQKENHDRKHGNSIKVVFNNNPQFIIGREMIQPQPVEYQQFSEQQIQSQPELDNQQRLHRLPRQPASNLPSQSFYDDDISSADESNRDETKVSSSERGNNHNCRDHKDKIGSHDIGIDVSPVSVGPMRGQAGSSSTSSHINHMTESRPKSPPPPPPLPRSDAKTFEKMIESGFRPPLQMMITVQKNDGKTVQVPLHFRGSMGNMNMISKTKPKQDTKVSTVVQTPTKTQEPVFEQVFEMNSKPYSKKTAEIPKMTDTSEYFEPKATETPPILSQKDDDFQSPISPPKTIQQTTIPKVTQDFVPKTSVKLPETKVTSKSANLPPDIVGKSDKSDCKHHDDTQQQDEDRKTEQDKKSTQDEIDTPEYNSMVEAFKNAFMSMTQQTAEQPEQIQESQTQEPQSHQQKDEQDEVMVAMMVANETRSNYGDQDQPRKISMTIVTPPKGTTVKEAMRQHQNPQRTVAILQSIQSKLPNLNRDRNQTMIGSPMIPTRMEVDLMPTLPKDNFVPINTMIPLNEGTLDIDPDGFSSSNDNYNLFERRRREIRTRKRRSVDNAKVAIQLPTKVNGTITQTNNTVTDGYGKNLEPEDKIQSSRRRSNSSSKLTKRMGGAFSQFDWLRPSRMVVRRNPDEDSMLASASESSSSSENSNDMDSDEDSDNSDSMADDSSGSSASAPMASESQDSVDDDSDEFGGDDSDDGSSAGDSNYGSDNDADEPFNLGSSSERDYKSPASFEVPQIEINPDTLRQKGCKTVLREVQEIPMDGLGVMQSNGKINSVGRRYRRQAEANNNLVNSRKITSIVMTKECHFPDDNQQISSRKIEPDSKGKSVNVKKDPRAQNTKRQEEYRQNPPKQQQYDRVDQVSSEPTNPTKTIHRQPNGLSNSKFADKRVDIPRPRSDRDLIDTSFDSRRMDPSIEQHTFRSRSFGPQKPSNNPRYFLLQSEPVERPQISKPRSMATQQQNLLTNQPTIGTIKRRSIGSSNNDKLPIRGLQNTRNSAKNNRETDPYTVADSRRNEIVAKKSYKPPTADEPYHTLSYSSKNGLDPDMDQDDDDTTVMEGDDLLRPASSGGRTLEAPTENERRALADPNHDDTDPVSRHHQVKKINEDRPVRQDNRDGYDSDEGDSDLSEEGSSVPGITAPNRRLLGPQAGEVNPRFGKSFRFKHEIQRPSYQAQGLASQFKNLEPGKQGFVRIGGNGPGLAEELGRKLSSHQAARRYPQSWPKGGLPNTRRNDGDDDPSDDANGDDDDEEDDRSSQSTRPRAYFRSDASDEPDSDPELNPKESQLPSSTKPKKFEKSFAYVHKDLPKKGSKNPDDFVISYGRGAVQTEHEDYDSDRDPHPGEHYDNQREPDRAGSSTRPMGVSLPMCVGPNCFRPSAAMYDRSMQLAQQMRMVQPTQSRVPISMLLRPMQQLLSPVGYRLPEIG